MAETILVTHVHPDLDGLLGLWILIRFGGHADYELVFVPVGKRLNENSNVVHVDTGLTQFDHHDSHAYTCAAQLVYAAVFGKGGNPAVAEMVKFALLTDWYRQPEQTNGPFTLNSMIEGLNQLYPEDPRHVAESTFEILDALHRNLTFRLQAEQELGTGFWFTSDFGRAFAINSGMPYVRELAHLQGARVFVFVDPTTGFRGYKARSQDGIDFSSVAQELKALEPQADWFLHSSKELLLCGSAKAPDRQLSQLPLETLVALIKRD